VEYSEREGRSTEVRPDLAPAAQPPHIRNEAQRTQLVVREATVADAPAIAAIGRVGFRAVHDDVIGPAFAASVVDQTYSIAALSECITRCTKAEDAEFLVAESDGTVLGYLHYDCEGSEPELHRIYVDVERKRAGVGSALMRELHARLSPGSSYVLLVVEANTEARAFYERHALTVERRLDGPSYFSSAMGLDVDLLPQAEALLMRYTNSSDARPGT
jgi:ribosomal protein S18 acetylase RimI-like enzyme